MDVRIIPSPLIGEIKAIPSKSDAHRCIICSACANAPTTIGIETLSADIEATLSCVTSLGAKVDNSGQGKILISPVPPSASPDPVLDCGESGSTLRFLLPVAAALCGRVSFIGGGRLPDRPLSPLTEEMERHGCRFGSKRLPFTVEGKMCGGRFTLPGNISSQFISGLLMAIPLTGDGGEIGIISPVESSGYIDMTIETMLRFGVRVDPTDSGYSISPGQSYISPGEAEAEGDWSNSAFWLAAGAMNGKISCKGLNPQSMQGDKKITEILQSMGADLIFSAGSANVKSGALHSAEIDASQIPDLIPVLSVAASVAEGTTIIRNAGRLRIKESDRLHTIADCLYSIGAAVTELEDGLIIKGQKSLTGGCVDSYNDHRIAMAMAVASTVCTGEVIIKNAESVSKSYPRFFHDFKMLGGTLDVIGNRAAD
jgi:3-phosphoshikimate 1-carboxyvinyltransferase